MKKVLMVSTCPLQTDGITKVIQNILNEMSGDYKIELVLGKGAEDKYKDYLDRSGIKYYITRDRELHPSAYIMDLWRILKKGNYSVIHVHGNSATMAIEMWCGKLRRVPIRISHGHQNMTYHPFVHKILKLPLNWCATSIVACGDEAGKFLSLSQRYTVVPNGIEIERFRYNIEIRKRIRKELDLINDYVIGHVGRFESQKNQNLLISILPELKRRIPNVKLFLVGEGSLIDAAKKQAADLETSENIVFWGNANNVNELMQAMDIFTLPSRFEGLGISAIEAQAAGLPCVLSDRIPRETIITNTCYYVDIDKPEKWVETILSASEKNVDRFRGAEEVTKAGYSMESLRGAVVSLWNN